MQELPILIITLHNYVSMFVNWFIYRQIKTLNGIDFLKVLNFIYFSNLNESKRKLTCINMKNQINTNYTDNYKQK